MADKKCFIIMPVTTPPDLIDKYSGDRDHFKHVLEHLFVPAIKELGIKPIPPIVKGSEVIHAEIIKNIESSDFVLCDMSILNPNVFFELGIRTVINKPIALVKDDVTPKVPFDTNIINNHTYSHRLTPWTLEKEIKNILDHLRHCFEGTQTENSLWKYFSLSAKAEPLHEPRSRDEKIDFLSMQIAALRKEIEKGQNDKIEPERQKERPYQEDRLIKKFHEITKREGAKLYKYITGSGEMQIFLNSPISSIMIKMMQDYAAFEGVKLKITVDKKQN